MFRFRRALRIGVTLLLAFAAARLAPAQNKAQFVQPLVELTGGRVTAMVPGTLQSSSGFSDLLYVNAPRLKGSDISVTAGLLLNKQGFTNLIENQVTFPGVLGVAAGLADLNQDNLTDLIFALQPLTSTAPNFCVFYGTGAPIPNPEFLPVGQLSGCETLPTAGQVPSFAWLAAAPFTTGALTQVFLVDRANNLIYVVGNNASPTNTGVLTGFHVTGTIRIPSADGAGPIYAADLNDDGKTDLILNNLGSNVATVYLGNGDGSFGTATRYVFDHHVHSLLLHDMNGDRRVDMVVEGDGGAIEIFAGNADGTFGPSAIGVFPPGGSLTGAGGHLAAIGDVNKDGIPDILTTTPAGLSVLLGQAGLRFNLKGIYNIGSGRSSFVLADLDGDGTVDLAVDSAEGVAILQGNGEGSFRSSLAYPVGAPALNAVVGVVRDAARNPNGNVDAVVATALNQAQVLTGDGTGAFSALPAPVNAQPPACVTAGNCTLWSNLLTGDFDGDGIADLLFSVTGLPLPTPGVVSGAPLGSTPALAVAFGRGDGTFSAVQVAGPGNAPATNNFAGETAVADLNGDGIVDIANIDANFYDTLLSRAGSRDGFALAFNFEEDAGRLDNEDLDSFSQVAVGSIAGGADLLFQDDANLIPFLNSGDGVHFKQMEALPNPPSENRYYENTVLIADVDGDGNGDVIVPYHSNGSDPSNPNPVFQNLLYIWYGNGDGTFSQPAILTLSRNFYLAQIADMDNNGTPDLVLSDGYVVGILYNNGQRSFGQTDPTSGITSAQDFLAGQGINSLSVADVNHDGALDLVVTNGGSTVSAPVALGGAGVRSIGLAPNANGNAGGITVLLNAILTQPVTGVLTSTPNPSRFQAPFAVTLSLTPSTGVPLPTGTVQFAVNGTVVGAPIPVVAGTTSSFAGFNAASGNSYQGTPGISAAYSGDARNSAATFYTTQTISGSATTTNLALCVGPTAICPITSIVIPPYVPSLLMYFGQEFNGSASASSLDTSVLDPASTIAFNDAFNGAPPVTLCTLGVNYGSACPPAIGTTVGTNTGTHVFTATYSGDATHAPSTSLPVTLTVLPDVLTGYTFTSSANPSPVGQPVTFTATVTGNFAAPTGTFPVLDGGTAIGTLTLSPIPGSNSSRGSLTSSTLVVGTHQISAPYPGNANFQPLASPVLTQVINTAVATTSRLVSSVNPSVTGQNVTFTDTVSLTTGAAPPTPTGTVTFYDGTSALGTATLNAAGVAALSTASLAAGTHTITATASGDLGTASSSATLVQVVTALPPAGSVNFSVTVTPNPVQVGVGNFATFSVTVAPVGTGFPEAVTLSCSGLPYESTCRFNNAVIPAGGGSTTLLVATTAPHSCGSTAPYFVAGNGAAPRGGAPLVLPALAALLSLGLPGRRRLPGRTRSLRALVALAAVAVAMQITACGTCTDLGTRPAAYTMRVSGASSVTPEVEGTAVSLTVHL